LTAYDRLIEVLKAKGSNLPLLKCEELYRLLEELYREDEAEFISTLPLAPFSAAGLSQAMGASAGGELADKLERMADKGQLHCVQLQTGETYYTINTLIPGFLEICFMPGQVDDHRKKVARLFEDYRNTVKDLPDYEVEGVWRFPLFRTLAVEKDIPGSLSVQPYDNVSMYVKKADYIAVGTCFCNQVQALTSAPCNKPKEVCMSFGPQAYNYIKRGFARSIAKDEAFIILDKAEQAGLVHCASNTGKYIDGLCNCCICHCGFLQNIRKSIRPYNVAPSGFVVEFDHDNCSSCGACVDRCQMGALTIVADEIVFSRERCIGCGLCISYCPQGLLELKARLDASTPPMNNTQLFTTMANSMKAK
jgi:Na+-translocating ferredoxin:NAD+ oxidoreductase subunit B